jgi:CubicO group peptidase (beta-lactamase class C family)
MKFLIVFILFISSFSTFSQTKSINKSAPLTEAKPEEVGMSSARLAHISTICKEAIEKGQIPGAVALVAKNGKIVFYEAYGMADHESNRALKKDDIFRIASQTKAITSTAVMMLWEEGKFKLDDPVSKYIPEFKDEQVMVTFNEKDSSFISKPASRPITIRHLLTHTSGIGYGMIDGDERFRKMYQKAGVTDLYTTENVTIEQSVKKLARLPLHHEPGEKFTYSEGLDVLGYFIEVVSGMPLDQFFRKRIFDPLGMHDTWFYLPENKYNRLVPVQHRVDGSWKKFPITFYDPEYPVKGARSFFSGGAGLVSTAKDYAAFLQMYLNKGELNGTRLLSRTTIDVIMANQIEDIPVPYSNTGKGHGLAFGVNLQKGQDLGGNGSVGTFNWGGYFNSQYFADPKENIIGIILKQTQGNNGDETEWKFRHIVSQAVDD